MNDQDFAREIMSRSGQEGKRRLRLSLKTKILLVFVGIFVAFFAAAGIVFLIENGIPERRGKPSDNGDSHYGGNNEGMRSYLSNFALKNHMRCDIEAVDSKTKEKYVVSLSFDDGHKNFDVMNLSLQGAHVNVKKIDSAIYVWRENGTEDYRGEMYLDTDGYYFIINEALSFGDLDVEKSKFDCDTRSGFYEIIGLPLTDWKTYNYDNAE